ncbi:peptide/nickel transport system substrate-binding protein [Amphibacillus marinus]|uniref:Peptide/nickel transport system substrate-binding protein n=1 Tax=Amphibacillus marinus TaxID=872970 RepID=A0A1H8PL25_9BACI|nr:ABC transporter substrate-binding protein [Amphibacillus marinus]SEO42486.1 peptide/nickel transport system substrate-binding protein [Amphibacillus marinus]
MKKLSLLFFVVMVLLLGCVNTESDVQGDEPEQTPDETNIERPTIEILGTSTGEDDLNILRDQLTNNGFEVELNIQPDYGSFTTQRDAGNYDLALSSWTTVTGNPDYAVRSLFTSDGDNSLFADQQADELVNLASTQLAEEYQETYKDLEQHIVFDQAYIAPLYISYKAQGVNDTIINEETVRLPKSRAAVWEAVDFNDASLRDSQPLLVHQAIGSLTSLDPIKGNDGSINTLNTNIYVRLVNLTDDDQVVSDGSLSLNHVIAEGNQDYYFLLRDDIYFAAIEEDGVVNTEDRVGAEDVQFSLNRAKDRNSVPDHRTYSLHESMDNIEIVSDLSELEDAVTINGDSVKEALEVGLDQDITELTTSKDDANNANGIYQAVKITTVNPFPQVLNYLAHQSAGIVSQQQVESVNTFDVEDYNVDEDIAYGDQRTVTEDSGFDNTLYASGPYILVSKNDYEAHFVKNPGYRAGTDGEPNINEVIVKFIQEPESALSALRNNEIHILNGVAENRYDTVIEDESLTLQQNESNGVTYLAFNMEGREVSTNVALRQAILHSINQDEFISFYQGNKMPAVSTVSPLVNTGLTLEADSERVQELLREAAE